MSILLGVLRRRILDRIGVAGLGGTPAPRSLGGDLMSRLAAVGILRLALRWPALSVLLIVSVLAARLLAKRPGRAGGSPALRAP